MFSITDHNSVASADIMKWYEGKYGNKTMYVNGVELSLYHENREIHVCSYAYDASDTVLAGILEIYQRNRVLQTELRVEKLQDMGFRIDYHELAKEAAGKLASGVTFLKVLAKYAENRPMLKDYLVGEKSDSPYTNFYFDYFTKGGPVYVDVPLLDFDETVQKMKDRSVLVVAHPSIYKDKPIKDITGKGISGIEVYSSYHKPEDIEFYHQYAKDNDLLLTAGSDFHGDRIKPGIYLGGHGCTDMSVAYRFIDRISSFKNGYFYI